MRRIAKWVLGILLFLTVILSIAILLMRSIFFQLEDWEPLTAEQIQQYSQNQDRPNILILMAEDLSSRVGAFGDPVALTPSIDKLASEGVRYTNVFTTAGVCSPSRAAFITGVHQISMGGQHMRTANRPAGGYRSVPSPEVKAFPELLRKSGYYTFNTTKLDYQFSNAFSGSGPFTIWDAEDDPELWRSREPGQPFFGLINLMETHETGLFTPIGTRPHSGVHFMTQLMRAFGGLYSGDPVDPGSIEVPPYFPDTEVVRSDMARHYQNINGMDRLVGEILDKLEKDGLLESTIIIWTTDHGDCLPRGKRELYDSGLKVPMIIRWPAGYPVSRNTSDFNNRLISFVDFAPTLLNIANAPIPDFLHGVDFLSDASRNYIYASRDRIDEVMDRQRAIRDGRFKYIRSWHPNQPGGHPLAFRDNLEIMRELWEMKEENLLTEEQLLWFQPPGEERLFDLENDPFELNDLSSDTSYNAVMEEMRRAMDNWLTEIGDWSDIPEDEMVDGFLDNGEQRLTPPPSIVLNNNMITLKSDTQGASVGFRVNKGSWKLYTAPFEVPTNASIQAKAIRYGWKESEIIEADF